MHPGSPLQPAHRNSTVFATGSRDTPAKAPRLRLQLSISACISASVCAAELRPTGPAATAPSAPTVNLLAISFSAPPLVNTSMTRSVSTAPIWNPAPPPSIRNGVGADHPAAPTGGPVGAARAHRQGAARRQGAGRDLSDRGRTAVDTAHHPLRPTATQGWSRATGARAESAARPRVDSDVRRQAWKALIVFAHRRRQAGTRWMCWRRPLPCGTFAGPEFMHGPAHGAGRRRLGAGPHGSFGQMPGRSWMG